MELSCFGCFLMVGSGGIEPPKPYDNGFTDRPGSPTTAPTHNIVRNLHTISLISSHY